MKKILFVILSVFCLGIFLSCEKTDVVSEEKLEGKTWYASKTELLLNGKVSTAYMGVELEIGYSIISLTFSGENVSVDLWWQGGQLNHIAPYFIADKTITFGLPIGGTLPFEVVKSTSKELLLNEKATIYDIDKSAEYLDRVHIGTFQGLDMYEDIYLRYRNALTRRYYYIVDGVDIPCQLEYPYESQWGKTYESVDGAIKSFSQEDINKLSEEDYAALKNILTKIYTYIVEPFQGINGGRFSDFRQRCVKESEFSNYLLANYDKFDWRSIAQETATENAYEYAKGEAEDFWWWESSYQKNYYNGEIYVGVYLSAAANSNPNFKEYMLKLVCSPKLFYNLDNRQDLLAFFDFIYKDSPPLPFLHFNLNHSMSNYQYVSFPDCDRLYFSLINKEQFYWYDSRNHLFIAN